MNYNRLIFRIACILFVLFSGLLIAIHLHEWIKVGLLKQIYNYPFGGEGSVPFYYKSAEFYSLYMFIWSILLFANLIIGIVSMVKKKRIGAYLAFGLLVLPIIALFIF